MRVAVIGIGGTGGYFGGMLARAGEDVTFVGRGPQLAAIQRDGLTVRSRLSGDFNLPVHATGDAAGIGPVDLVLVCTKTYDLESALAHLPALIGRDTMVLSLQNGIDNEDRIAAVTGLEHVLGGQAQIVAAVVAPGIIEQSSPFALLIFSELGGGSSSRAERLLATFQQAGISANLRADGRVHIWEKFVDICPYSGMTTLMRLPIGPIFACPESVALYRLVVEETLAVGRATGVALGPHVADEIMDETAVHAARQPSATSSMQRDLAAGKRLELEGLQGTVVRLGRAHGVPTPATSVIYAALKPFAAGTPEVATAQS